MSRSVERPVHGIRRARPGARGHGITLQFTAGGSSEHRHVFLLPAIPGERRGPRTRAISPAAPGATARRGSIRTPSATNVKPAGTCRGWQKAATCVSGSSSSPPSTGLGWISRPHPCRLVEQLERDRGTRVEWRAVEHSTTPPTPHVHLVVARARRERARSRSRSANLSGGLAATEPRSWRRRSFGFRSGREAPGRRATHEVERWSGSRGSIASSSGGPDVRGRVPNLEERATGTRSSRTWPACQEAAAAPLLEEASGCATKVGVPGCGQLLPRSSQRSGSPTADSELEKRLARQPRAYSPTPPLPPVVESTGSGARASPMGRAIAR